MARFVVHNARDELGLDVEIWLVIDTINGTAISQNSNREDAEHDWVLLTAFYNQRPEGQPMDNASIPLALHGSAPQFRAGHWQGHNFDADA